MQHHVHIFLRRYRIPVITESPGDHHPESGPIHLVGLNELVKHPDPIRPGQPGVKPHHGHRMLQAIDMVFDKYRDALQDPEEIKDAQTAQETEIVDRDLSFFLGEDFAVDVEVGIEHICRLR